MEKSGDHLWDGELVSWSGWTVRGAHGRVLLAETVFPDIALFHMYYLFGSSQKLPVRQAV